MREVSCPQCGRRVAVDERGAGACSSCGHVLAPGGAVPDREPVGAQPPTPLVGDDSATRPIPPVTEMPVTAPMVAAPTVAAAVDAATRPIPPEWRPTSGPPPSQSPDVGAPGGRPAGSGARTAGILALLLVLLAIVILAVLTASGAIAFNAAGATPTPQTAATPTIPPGFQPYTATGYFRLNVPGDWSRVTIPPNPNASARPLVNQAFADTSLTDHLNIEVVNSGDAPGPQPSVEQVLATLAGGKPIQNRQGPQPVTVGGQSWTRETGDMAVQGIAGTSHVVALATARGQHTYILYYWAPVNNFDVVDIADFRHMLDSFTFLG